MRSKSGTNGFDQGASRRSLLAVALLLAATAPLLSACGSSGFQPPYGSSGIGANVDERLAQVDVAPIPGRVGQRIRNELIFQSTGGGAQQTPTLRLEVAIRESVTSTLVRQDGNADAQVYGLEANFTLVRVADNSVVLKGTSFSRAGFERFESIFSNVRAREDAENRAARTLGDDLKSRLVAYLAKPA
jgi:LPS-assembly lipoprotein